MNDEIKGALARLERINRMGIELTVLVSDLNVLVLALGSRRLRLVLADEAERITDNERTISISSPTEDIE